MHAARFFEEDDPSIDGMGGFSPDVARGSPDLFWPLARALWLERRRDELFEHIGGDLAEMAAGARPWAEPFFLDLLRADDMETLDYLIEGFDPQREAELLCWLAELACQVPQAKRFGAWCAAEGLIAPGADGFRKALFGGNVELAKGLWRPSAEQAEALLAERPKEIGKEALAHLCFLSPAIVGFASLRMLLERGAPQEVLTFLMWKMEGKLTVAELAEGAGDSALLPRLLTLALERGLPGNAKRLVEWNPLLAQARLAPAELPAPWRERGPAIQLDGAVPLLASEWACVFGHEPFARALADAGAPAPSATRLQGLVAAFARIREKRKLPAEPWASAAAAGASAAREACWPLA